VGNLKSDKSQLGGFLLVTLAVIVFSTIEVASQHVQREQGLSVFDLSLLRFGIGGIVLGIAALIRTGKKEMFSIIKSDGWRIALLGLIGTTALSMFYHRSLMLTSSMIGGAIFSINPAIVALLFLIARIDKPTLPRLLGVALGVICVLVTNKRRKISRTAVP